MLATSRAAMNRVVNQILQPERFRGTIRDLVAAVTNLDVELADADLEGSASYPYDTTWMPRFCELLAKTGNVLSAFAGLRAENPGSPARSTIYERRKRCPRFSREWAEALRGRNAGDVSE